MSVELELAKQTALLERIARVDGASTGRQMQSRWGRVVDLLRLGVYDVTPPVVIERLDGAPQLDSMVGAQREDAMDIPRDVTVTVRADIRLPPNSNWSDPSVLLRIDRGSGASMVFDEFPVRLVGQVFHICTQKLRLETMLTQLALFGPLLAPTFAQIQTDVSPGSPTPWSAPGVVTSAASPFLSDIAPFTEFVMWNAINAAGNNVGSTLRFIAPSGLVVATYTQPTNRPQRVPVPRNAVQVEITSGAAARASVTYMGHR